MELASRDYRKDLDAFAAAAADVKGLVVIYRARKLRFHSKSASSSVGQSVGEKTQAGFIEKI